MYNYLDENNQQISTIEPEYTAIYNSQSHELFYFVNNMIDTSTIADNFDHAANLFESWMDENNR